MRFTYEGAPKKGDQATLTCTEDVTVAIITTDDSGVSLEYDVVTKKNGSASKPVTGRVELKNKKAIGPVEAKAIRKSQRGDRRHLMSDSVDFRNQGKSGVDFDSDGSGDDVVMVKVKLEDDEGNTIHRSIIAKTRRAPPAVKKIKLDSWSVNGDGDLELSFKQLPSGTVLLSTVISIVVGETTVGNPVELSAITDTGRLTFHGGWIRKILDEADGSTDGWQVKIDEMAATDPNDSYRLLAEQDKAETITISTRRRRLSEQPSQEEKDISKDMRQGRPPANIKRLRSRELQSDHKKILVHGYW